MAVPDMQLPRVRCIENDQDIGMTALHIFLQEKLRVGRVPSLSCRNVLLMRAVRWMSEHDTRARARPTVNLLTE